MDHAHTLSKGLLYEQVMQDKMLNATKNMKYNSDDTNINKKNKNYGEEDEFSRLQAIDTALRAFVVQERKSKARLKVKYLLVGAMTHRFEEAVTLLWDR